MADGVSEMDTDIAARLLRLGLPYKLEPPELGDLLLCIVEL